MHLIGNINFISNFSNIIFNPIINRYKYIYFFAHLIQFYMLHLYLRNYIILNYISIKKIRFPNSKTKKWGRNVCIMRKRENSLKKNMRFYDKPHVFLFFVCVA